MPMVHPMRMILATSFMPAPSTTPLEGIEIEDLTLDVNQFENSSTPSNLLPHVVAGVDNREKRGSGVILWGVKDSAIRRVRVRNAGTWGVNLGHWDGTDEALVNRNIVFQDMLFESLSDTSNAWIVAARTDSAAIKAMRRFLRSYWDASP